jgi:hypothetical protein
MIIKIKDMLSKVLGVGITTTFTTIGLWMSIQTFIKTFIKLMIDGLLASVAIIVLLWIIPFTWELAAVYTGLFATLAGFMGVVIHGAENIIHESASVPKTPACFDEDTLIQLEDGWKVPIKDIDVNMKLYDGGIVTGLFKVSQNEMDMYNYKGVIVSDNHNVLYKNVWVPVCEIREATKIENYSKDALYCINTTTKKIIINDVIFSDWDDIDNKELITLRKKILDKFGVQLHYNNIHSYLDGGFSGDTKINLNNGRCINIKDVNINDVLSLGNVVKGVVRISTSSMNIHRFELNGKLFICGPNNIVDDSDLGCFSTLTLPSVSVSPRKKPKYLYHLITNNKIIYIDGVIFKDFNGSLETFLEESNEDIHRN